jgi:hypothetical protein
MINDRTQILKTSASTSLSIKRNEHKHDAQITSNKPQENRKTLEQLKLDLKKNSLTREEQTAKQ